VGATEQFEAIDHVLLRVSEADQRAADGARELEKAGAPPHLVAALKEADRELLVTHRRLLEALNDGRRPAINRLSNDDDQLAHVRDEPVSRSSAATPRLDQVNESHMAEVESALFVMSEARRRAERTARELAKDGAEPHLVEAMERAERELEATIDAFFKSTYFHVPKDQLALS
jgi:hypothetical protein